MAPNLSTIMRLDNARPNHVYMVEQLEAKNKELIDAAVAVLGNGLYGIDSKLGRLRTAVNALLTGDDDA